LQPGITLAAMNVPQVAVISAFPRGGRKASAMASVIFNPPIIVDDHVEVALASRWQGQFSLPMAQSSSKTAGRRRRHCPAPDNVFLGEHNL